MDIAILALFYFSVVYYEIYWMDPVELQDYNLLEIIIR